MVDIALLRQKIKDKGITLEELADKLGMSRSTLYRKLLEDGRNLSLKEISGIISELALSEQETSIIFFRNLSQK